MVCFELVRGNTQLTIKKTSKALLLQRVKICVIICVLSTTFGTVLIHTLPQKLQNIYSVYIIFLCFILSGMLFCKNFFEKHTILTKDGNDIWINHKVLMIKPSIKKILINEYISTEFSENNFKILLQSDSNKTVIAYGVPKNEVEVIVKQIIDFLEISTLKVESNYR